MTSMCCEIAVFVQNDVKNRYMPANFSCERERERPFKLC